MNMLKKYIKSKLAVFSDTIFIICTLFMLSVRIFLYSYFCINIFEGHWFKAFFIIFIIKCTFGIFNIARKYNEIKDIRGLVWNIFTIILSSFILFNIDTIINIKQTLNISFFNTVYAETPDNVLNKPIKGIRGKDLINLLNDQEADYEKNINNQHDYRADLRNLKKKIDDYDNNTKNREDLYSILTAKDLLVIRHYAK